MIGKNTHLRVLALNGQGIRNNVVGDRRSKSRLLCRKEVDDARRRFRLLSEGINKNRSITLLRFEDFHQLGGDVYHFLAPFLEHNNNLQYIQVRQEWNEIQPIPVELRLIASALARRESPLEMLHLEHNDICDDSVEGLIQVFCENPALTPKKIVLRKNNIGHSGCESIARLLQDPRCTMEELDIECNNNSMRNHSAVVLANALVTNKSLKKIELAQTNINVWGFENFLQTVCDTRSIDATYKSNHMLYYLGYFDYLNYTSDSSDEHHRDDHFPLSLDLRVYLAMNANEDKKTVACRKVLINHFHRKLPKFNSWYRPFNFHMQPFEEMAPELLVGSIHFIDKWGEDNDKADYEIARRSILYQLIKSDPMICKIDACVPSEAINAFKRRRL